MKRTYILIDGEWVERKRDKRGRWHYVMPDIQPYKSMIDGRMITSRSEHRAHLKAHNCAIMRTDAFRCLFEPLGIEAKFCGYVGGFQVGGSPFVSERSLRGYAAVAFDRVQDMLDHCRFLFCPIRLPESRWSSHLAFIGRRISQQ